MITDYPCPIPTCGWPHGGTATPAAGSSYGAGLTDLQVVGAHFVTHPPGAWIQAWFAEKRRADEAEARLARTLAALESAAIAALDGVSPGGRMPSRAEVYGGCDG